MTKATFNEEKKTTLPECYILAIVFSDVEGTKWFSKFLFIIWPIHIPLKWHRAFSSQSLELLPERPLEVDVAVVEEKHGVVGSQVPQLYCIQLGVQYPKNSKIFL